MHRLSQDVSGQAVLELRGRGADSEARTIELEDLLTKTNPVLADRIQFKEQIRDLGGDDRFAVAYEQVEGMRPGVLRADLLRKLLDWPRLGETQRAELGQHIGALSRAWQFARQMAIGFPASSGSLAYVMAALVVGLILLCVPATRTWQGGSIAVGAVLIATLAVEYIL